MPRHLVVLSHEINWQENVLRRTLCMESKRKYLDSVTRASDKVQLTYVRPDTSGDDAIRSETHTVAFVPRSLDDVAVRSFAGQCTLAEGRLAMEEYLLKPVTMYGEPFRWPQVLLKNYFSHSSSSTRATRVPEKRMTPEDRSRMRKRQG